MNDFDLGAESALRVRMYRPGGIGDCFLLSFPGGGQMLIDCGVLYNTPYGNRRLQRIAENIAQVSGHHLDVVVATHEHWDHLCGFTAAREIFDEIDIDQLWLAWTEDPADPLAGRLRRQREEAQLALDAALEILAGDQDPRRRAFLASLSQLFNLSGGLRATSGGRRRIGTREQLDYLLGRVEAPRFLRPGDGPLPMPRSDGGARVYVLGPPRDEALLSRYPSRAHSEVYEDAVGLTESRAFLTAALAAAGLSGADPAAADHAAPFPNTRSLTADEARDFQIAGNPEEDRYFFRRFHGIAGDPEDGPDWRRIDHDWLAGAGALALRLDNDTNNTSLVLAIEVAGESKVLLFPGDAQVGNWLSWRQVSWTGDDGTRLTGDDLLRRTVLYKVGHHGSHNATLRDRGLELMQSRELVALLPVVEEQAAKLGWRMPFKRLLERLEEKTEGRILRADKGLAPPPGGCAGGAWRDFAARVQEDPGGEELWIDYRLPLAPPAADRVAAARPAAATAPAS